MIDLSPGNLLELGTTEPPFNGDEEVNAYLHIAIDDPAYPTVSVRDVTPEGASASALFPIFGERASVFDGWKLSYGSNHDFDAYPEYSDRATVTCVASDEANTCYAWHIEKSDSSAVLGSGGDGGVWSLPFAMGVCLLDHVGSGDACWDTVFGS